MSWLKEQMAARIENLQANLEAGKEAIPSVLANEAREAGRGVAAFVEGKAGEYARQDVAAVVRHEAVEQAKEAQQEAAVREQEWQPEM